MRERRDRTHQERPAPSGTRRSRDLALQRLRIETAKALLDKQDKQISSNETLDRSRAETVRAGSLVLPLTVALLQFARDPSYSPSIWQLVIFWALLVLGFSAFAALLVCSYAAKRLTQMEYRPRLQTMGERVTDWVDRPLGEQRAARWLAEEYTGSTNKNLPILTAKAKWVGLSETFLYAEVVFLAFAVLPMLVA